MGGAGSGEAPPGIGRCRLPSCHLDPPSPRRSSTSSTSSGSTTTATGSSGTGRATSSDVRDPMLRFIEAMAPVLKGSRRSSSPTRGPVGRLALPHPPRHPLRRRQDALQDQRGGPLPPPGRARRPRPGALPEPRARTRWTWAAASGTRRPCRCRQIRRRHRRVAGRLEAGHLDAGHEEARAWWGESLKRTPRGFPAEHPLDEALRRQGLRRRPLPLAAGRRLARASRSAAPRSTGRSRRPWPSWPGRSACPGDGRRRPPRGRSLP